MEIREAFTRKYTGLLVNRLTLSIFAITGVLVAFAEWGVLSREVLVVGVPAIIATLLVDTFLFNEFLIRTGPWLWLILYVFLYFQSIIVATLIRLLTRIRPENGEQVIQN
ncbi:hypothetical protein ACFQE1_01585 [Halobium palmae]|uniref:Uncharacterized protein n=1 Tax=Halobium palmae TaxID=1776492 RepID=A0ABD5RVZ4_9EURY